MSNSDFIITLPQGGLSAATVISTLPVPLDEKKPGVSPGIFQIPAAKDGDFEVLVVGPSYFCIDMGENRPAFRVTQHPTVLAQSIVMDYKVAHVLYIPGEAEPGLFWVPGAKVKEQILHEHKMELQEALRLQHNWYRRLVELADDSWARTRQFRSITDLMRLAGKALKLERDWLIDREIKEALSECPVCKEKVVPDAILCKNCKFVLKPEEMRKLKGQFVDEFTV